ncbi:MAG: DUF3109 family protein [Paludibacteraceae bacterium]|nr:DUF3109 family protein [Paludibacteraceae bacterium]
MLQIGETIVSFDMLEKAFICDLSACKGQCCVEGDSGAPLEESEVEIIKELLPVIWDDLSDKSKAVIEAQGVAYRDIEGDLVTSIVGNGECVFSYIDEDGNCKCAIEKACRAGKTDFYKPISCHLYPVRLGKYATYTAVNFHKWKVCKAAFELGKKNGTPVYQFLKGPLIRKFGEDWYAELELAAEELYKSGMVKHPSK